MSLEYRHDSVYPGVSRASSPGSRDCGQENAPLAEESLSPMFRRRRQMRKLRRVARVLLELDPARTACPPSRASSSRSRAVVGRGWLGRGRERRLVEQAAERLRLEQAPPPRAVARQLELREDRARRRASTRPRRARHSLREPAAQLLVALGRVEDPAHDELRRDGAVPAVLLRAGTRRRSARAAEAVDLRAAAERDRRAGVAAALADAEAEVLAVADGRRARSARSRRRAASRPGCRGRTGPRRAELLAERQPELASRRRPRRPRCAGGGRRRRAPRRRARRTPPRTPRRARAGSSARRRRGGRRSARGAPAHAASAPCRSNAPGRAARALPVAVGAGDQHDRPAEALDEARRDDPDHALVPVRAGDDVAAMAAARLGPRLDLVDRGAEDPLLDAPAARGSAPRARRRAASPRAASSVSSSASAASGRPSRPAALIRGASRKPIAPSSHAAGSTPRDAHERPQPGLLRLREPPQPEPARARGSRRGAARRRRRSRARRGRGAGRGTGARRRAAPRRASRRRRSRRGPANGYAPLPSGATTGQSGNASPGRWWSVTTMLEPEPRAPPSTSATAVIPQSTVSTRSTPSAASRASVWPFEAVALLEPRRQVPLRLGAELAQQQHGERGRADPVGVVVAVDADPRAGRDRGPDRARPPRACRRARTDRGPGSAPSRNARAAAGSP